MTTENIFGQISLSKYGKIFGKSAEESYERYLENKQKKRICPSCETKGTLCLANKDCPNCKGKGYNSY